MTSPWQESAIFVVRQTGSYSPYLDTASSVPDRWTRPFDGTNHLPSVKDLAMFR